jgi:N utilization substance protein A
MSLAIGKEGQNARLAYKLTGWRIDIKGPDLCSNRAAISSVRPRIPT